MTIPGAVDLDGALAAVATESLVVFSVACGGLTGITQTGRLIGATASGAPASGTWAQCDFAVDAAGKIWICTVAGTPGTWVQSGSAGATFTGVVNLNAGTDSAGSAPILTALGFTTGTAAQLADLTRDYQVYLEVTTSGTATSVTIGHTSSANDVTIMASAAATAGQVISFRLPAGWFVKWTGTTTAIGNQVAVGC